MQPSPEPPEPWPEAWWPLCVSRSLSSRRPLGVQRLGRRLVLWRDAQGTPRAAPAACPHRGTDLSLGKVRQGRLQCPYHGFQFEGDGRCVAVPCEGRDAKIPPGLHLRPLALTEAHGFVFGWLGEGAPAPLTLFSGEPDLDGPVAVREMIWPVRWSRVVEAMLDLHHLPFAHPWITPPGLSRLHPYEARFDERGILRSRGELRRENAASGWAVSIDLAPPSLLRLTFGEGFGGLVACVPMDAESTWIGIRYFMHIPWLGVLPFVDRLAAELALMGELWLVQPDDLRMVANAWPRSGGIEHEQLVHADKAIALWHAWRRRTCRGTMEDDGPLPLSSPPSGAP